MSSLDSELQHDFLRKFTSHEPAIRAYVRRLVPSRSDADDVMQDVSIILWKKFGEFRSDGDFRSWAFGVVRFAALAWRRDKARDRLVLDDDVVEKLAAETAADEPRLAGQREALEGCMKKVDPSERRLLMEAYQPDARMHDTASRSGRTVAGFYQWLHRVRRMLLQCIRRSLAEQTASPR